MKDGQDRERNAAQKTIDFTTLPSGKVIVTSRGGFPGVKNVVREIPPEIARANGRWAHRKVFVVHGD